MIFTKNQPRIVNAKTGDMIPLRKRSGMFIWRVVVDPNRTSKDSGVFEICAAEVSWAGDVLATPRLETDENCTRNNYR